jgi:hypothetical protein
MRPTWELLYNHYVVIKGMDAPWTTKFLNESLNYYGGAEGGAGSWGEGSGHYDGLGWGSLLHHLDEEDVAAQGSGANTLIASPSAGKATSTPLPESTPGSSSAVSSGVKSTSAAAASTSAANSTPSPQSSPSTSSPGTSTPAATPDPQSTPRPTEAGQKPSHGHRHHRHGHKHGGCRAHSLV